MVLPAPPADDGGAAWLEHLSFALRFGSGGRIVLAIGAGPAHIPPIVDALGDAHVCVSLDELRAVPVGATAVVALRRELLGPLNLARPYFADRALRTVLLVEDDVFVEAKTHAADLIDWASETVFAPPLVPRFVRESLWVVARAVPGVRWLGTIDEAAVAVGVDALPAIPCVRTDYDGAVQALRAAPASWLVAHVEDESDALRLRIAMAEAGRRRRVLAIGAKVPGWPTLDPTPAAWDLIDHVDPPMTGPRLVSAGAEPDAWISAPLTVDAMRRALSGNGPMRDLRRSLAHDDLKLVRRAFYKDARRALAEGDTRYFDQVAAWADRAHSVFNASLDAPRLAAAALPALMRSGAATELLATIAGRMAWPDLAHRWSGRWSPAPDPAPKATEAEAQLREQLELQGRLRGAQHPRYVRALRALAEVVLRAGRPDEALELAVEARQTALRHAAPDAPERDDTAHTLGVTLTGSGRVDEAIPLLQAALEARVARDGADHWSTRSTRNALVKALRRAGRFDEARQLDPAPTPC